MKRKIVVTAFLSALCLSSFAQVPARKPGPPERSEVIKAAKEIMQKARFCTFVTVGEDGHPQARIIDPFPPEDDLTVWAATNPLTRKVGQIKKDPRVTLLYYDPASMSYVTLLGKAEIVDDPAEKEKHWKEEWASQYKDKNKGEGYMLFRVKSFRLEIVNWGRGLANDPKTGRPVVLELR
jgi:general stress protein 26